MIDRTTTRFTAALAAAALLFAAAIPADAAAAIRGVGGTMTVHAGHASPSYGGGYGHGYGYGRGWCYWHPYVCYRF
jgi:hypothetical protein